MNKILAITSYLFIITNAWAGDYDRILDRLNELDKLPHTSLFTLGKNDQGKDIVGLAIGDPSRAVTKHLVVGTHHGNERAAAIVPLHFIEKIVNENNNETLYYVIPVLNISGYDLSRRTETGPTNSTHDSNRDYEDACLTKPDFLLKSTSLISEFVDRENIISAVSIHGYVGTFTYPWGTNMRNYSTRDDSFMEAWARKAVKHNGYRTGTHGAVIYPAEGSFEDWAYYKHGVWSYLMEIRSPSSDLKKDAMTLVEFFRNAPKERSKNIGQPVNCLDRILKYHSESRP